MARRAELVGIVRPEVDDQELDRQASKMEREFEGVANLTANIDTRQIQRKLEQAIPGGGLLGTAVDAIARDGDGGGATTAGRNRDAASGTAKTTGAGALLKIEEEQLDKLEDIHTALQQGGGAGGGGGGGGLLGGLGLARLVAGGGGMGMAGMIGAGGLFQALGGLTGDKQRQALNEKMPGIGGDAVEGATRLTKMSGIMGPGFQIDAWQQTIEDLQNFDWPSLPSLENLSWPNLPSLNALSWPGLPSLDDLSWPNLPSLTNLSWPNLPSLTDLSWPSLPSLNELTWPNLPSLNDLSWPELPSLNALSWPSLPSLDDLSWPSLPSLNDLSWPNLPSLSDLSWPSLPTLNDLTWPEYPEPPQIDIPRPNWLSRLPGVSDTSGESGGDGRWEGAAGGVVTGPTNALIGEGSESEAVMPLSALEGTIKQASARGVRAAGGQPAGSSQRRPNPFLKSSEDNTPDQPARVDAEVQVNEVSVTLETQSLRTAFQDGIDQIEREVKRSVEQELRNEVSQRFP
jgi:hypothetical protein